MFDTNDLPNVRNHLYKRAELWWTYSLAVSTITLGSAFVAVWIDGPVSLSFAGIFALAAPISIAWMREAASLNLLRGDKCRRLILYADALGDEIKPEDRAQIRAWTIKTPLKEAPFVRPYYSSAMAPGPNRLADIVAESAFFTEHLSGKLAAWLWLAFGLSVAAVCIILYVVGMQWTSSDRVALLVAKSAAVLVSFLLAGDFLLIAKKYSDLRIEAQQAFVRCSLVRNESGVGVNEIRTIAEDYNIAVLQAPPIPAWLYLIYRDDLNRIYRVSHTAPSI